MTLTDFLQLLRKEFPKAQYKLSVDAQYVWTPAHTQIWLGGKTSYPEEEKEEADYRLIFTPNFFLKSHQNKTFQAPSLQALWETLKATYLLDGTDTTKEIEDWLGKQEAKPE